MAGLLIITGPPGAGKSTVAQALARQSDNSVLVEGDSFFGFLASGAREPWLPESNEQNDVVTRAAAAAAGTFALGGYTTIYDGVVGPWFLPTFGAATGLEQVDYVVLLPSVERCVQRVSTRRNHTFTDQAATRKMHGDFALADVAERHVIRDPPEDLEDVSAQIQSALASGRFTYKTQ
jgi:gluconate kinase